MESQPFQRQVRIAASPQLREAGRRQAKIVDERERDTRPGRFTVSGTFICLPETGADAAGTARFDE